jgi:hypothetical protein
MEKKTLVLNQTAPTSKTNSRGVDLSRPAAVRIETCSASSGTHIKEVTLEMLR